MSKPLKSFLIASSAQDISLIFLHQSPVIQQKSEIIRNSCQFSDKNNEDSHDSSKQVVSTAVLDEEGYLPPRTLKVGQNYDSDDNDDEYLKPTFGKFTRIGKDIF